MELDELHEGVSQGLSTTQARETTAQQRRATALRIGATTLLRSQSYLGAQYRRLRGKLGAPKAITAMAHKLAVLVYRMLRYGHEYVDKGMQYYEERHREQQILLLKKRAAKLGLAVV